MIDLHRNFSLIAGATFRLMAALMKTMVSPSSFQLPYSHKLTRYHLGHILLGDSGIYDAHTTSMGNRLFDQGVSA